MTSSVTLSAATRQNLLSLRDTAALAATNQNHLSTGKKVNSALDNPVNYFTAAGLTDRSTALSGLLDGISNGIQAIRAASTVSPALSSRCSLWSPRRRRTPRAIAEAPEDTGLGDHG